MNTDKGRQVVSPLERDAGKMDFLPDPSVFASSRFKFEQSGSYPVHPWLKYRIQGGIAGQMALLDGWRRTLRNDRAWPLNQNVRG